MQSLLCHSSDWSVVMLRTLALEGASMCHLNLDFRYVLVLVAAAVQPKLPLSHLVQWNCTTY